jgi:hypothetical protein
MTTIRYRPVLLCLAVLALLVSALAATTHPAHAAPSANAGQMSTVALSAPAASSTPCSFVQAISACQSTDSTVTYYDTVTGDAADCTFVFNIAWGDGASTTTTVTNPVSGSHNLVGEHTYATHGTYTINVNPQITAGTSCTTGSSVHTFTLLAPTPSPINKSAHKCLGAAAFPLNDLCVTAKYTVLDAHRLRINSVEVCVDVMGPALSAVARPEVNIYSSGPKIWSRTGKALIYGPFVFASQKCEWFYPRVIATRGKVGVWGGSAEGVFEPPKGDEEIISPEWVGVSNFR